MNIAAARAAAGAAPGLVVIAEEQTAGRGRHGNVWLAPPGTCLLLTALFRPSREVARTPGLTVSIAERVADAIAEVAGIRPTIKEPNDLLIGGKKVVGVLCQTSVSGDWLNHLLVGIGVNVNVPEEDLPFPTATSLLAVTGHPQNRDVLLDAILRHLQRLPDLVLPAGGPDASAADS